MHFLHLTGIKTKMSASMFFSACVENRLSIKDISMDATGKTQQKLAVLPYLAELLYHNCMIGNFINSGIAIKADYFIGDTKATISVGFRQNGFADIPVTLYHENIKNYQIPRVSCWQSSVRNITSIDSTSVHTCPKDMKFLFSRK